MDLDVEIMAFMADRGNATTDQVCRRFDRSKRFDVVRGLRKLAEDGYLTHNRVSGSWAMKGREANEALLL